MAPFLSRTTLSALRRWENGINATDRAILLRLGMISADGSITGLGQCVLNGFVRVTAMRAE